MGEWQEKSQRPDVDFDKRKVSHMDENLKQRMKHMEEIYEQDRTVRKHKEQVWESEDVVEMGGFTGIRPPSWKDLKEEELKRAKDRPKKPQKDPRGKNFRFERDDF